jgi:hypothetical protein
MYFICVDLREIKKGNNESYQYFVKRFSFAHPARTPITGLGRPYKKMFSGEG